MKIILDMEKPQDKPQPAPASRHVVGVIPARLESQRLPRKPLLPICGHAMIDWVYRRSRPAPSLDHLWVATDSEEIFEHCRRSGMPALMTSPAHRSGTDRVVEVMSRVPADIYVNIQGDEPTVTAEHIELLLQPFRQSPATLVSTLKVAMSAADAQDPNNVKVVTDAAGQALYFSRAPVPYHRAGAGSVHYFKHLGLYAYRPAALEQFRTLAPSYLEEMEKLEQLRFLENGIPIAVVETAVDTLGIDTERDLQRVEEFFLAGRVTLPGSAE